MLYSIKIKPSVPNHKPNNICIFNGLLDSKSFSLNTWAKIKRNDAKIAIFTNKSDTMPIPTYFTYDC